MRTDTNVEGPNCQSPSPLYSNNHIESLDGGCLANGNFLNGNFLNPKAKCFFTRHSEIASGLFNSNQSMNSFA